MLEALTEGERCVCDLQRIVGSDLSTVSKHLALMREAGLVADWRQGVQVFYRLRVPCVLSFLDCVDAVRAGDGASPPSTPKRDRVEVAACLDRCPRTPRRARA